MLLAIAAFAALNAATPVAGPASTPPAQAAQSARAAVVAPRPPNVAVVGRTWRVDTLLARYRAAAPPVTHLARVQFEGVGARDVYNPTAPFQLAGKTLMAARVESPALETDSRVRFFERGVAADGRETWKPVRGAPVLALQDPTVSRIGGEIVVGGVQVTTSRTGQITGYRTVFYRGTSLADLRRFEPGPGGKDDVRGEGPPEMKDIRLHELPNGKILVMTRPQGERGGRGKIGYTTIDRLDDLSPEVIARAPVIEGMFHEEEWGGTNALVQLDARRVGVLGHIARFDEAGNRHYYPMTFVLDPERHTVSKPKILFERKDLPGGLSGPTKRADLADVLFSGGIVRHGDGTATVYVGAGDKVVEKVGVRDPFEQRVIAR